MKTNYIMLFSLTVFFASIIPGPSMLLALTHGMNHGAKRTVISAMGNVSVTLIQASISMAGLGTILLASETLFQLIKWTGVLYLIYMGIKILLSKGNLISPEKQVFSKESVPLKKMYLQAALVTAGNPKAILFFTAVFPQFLIPEKAGLSQYALYITTCALIAFSCFMIYAVSGEKIVSFFSGAKAGKYIKRIIGGSFISAGIGLAVSHK